MRLTTPLAAVLSAAVLLTACGDPSGTTNHGSIRGTVTDNAGATVAGAAVALTGNGQAARTANSGNDGVYTFAEVPPGTYSIAVTPPTGFTIGAAGTTSVTVGSGAQANASALIVNRAIGSIRGTVTDNSGAGVANVTVALSGNGQTGRTTNSGANGVYTFADVPAGPYSLAVTPPTGFTLGGAGTASVTVSGGSEANAGAFVLSRVTPDACAIARPDFGGPATAADRALFAYDINAPLNLQVTLDSTKNGVEFNSITFDSPAGGSATGIMYKPVGRTGLRPGIVAGHASGSPTGPVQGARVAMFEMRALAERGAVVIGIDAPYSRRGAFAPPSMSSLDRPEHIRLLKDMQRAVDVLIAQGNVDTARIAFTGYSFGAMIGVHFAGIERRIKAAVITAGYGGNVTARTNANLLPGLAAYPCAQRTTWFSENVPIEPIRFIPGASPTALLFQIARLDVAVLLADAQAVYDAASSPKEVLYYDTGHGFNAQATTDRYAWLAKQIGIDP